MLVLINGTTAAVKPRALGLFENNSLQFVQDFSGNGNYNKYYSCSHIRD
jgi:hypothetical protein